MVTLTGLTEDTTRLVAHLIAPDLSGPTFTDTVLVRVDRFLFPFREDSTFQGLVPGDTVTAGAEPTVTLTVVNQRGDGVLGVEVQWSTSDTTSTITPANGRTDAAGVVTVVYSPTEPGPDTIRARVTIQNPLYPQRSRHNESN